MKIIVIETEKYFDIIKGDKQIRIAKKHAIYVDDVKQNFDFYYNPVENENSLVDYSSPKLHKFKGYDLHKVMVPSFAEPISSTLQYLDFAGLDEKSVVIDLGAYSGLSSILFDQAITRNNPNAQGRVIAVDADIFNISCICYNLTAYKNITGRYIEYLHGAVWEKDGEVEFSHEENMGASVTEIVGCYRGKVEKVQSYTLSSIAKMYDLKKIDFIKCDIEGAEIAVFKDDVFFKKHRPKIIVESHLLPPYNVPKLSTNIYCEILEKYGYQFEEIKQTDYPLPLGECTPADTDQEWYYAVLSAISRKTKIEDILNVTLEEKGSLETQLQTTLEEKGSLETQLKVVIGSRTYRYGSKIAVFIRVFFPKGSKRVNIVKTIMYPLRAILYFKHKKGEI